MKRSLKSLVYKLGSPNSKKLEGGFTILNKVRGGSVTEPTDPDPGAVTNDICHGPNKNGCSNVRDCSDTTNAIYCHNLATCFTD
jgi:hypothetical protein